jgi:hypothetical protein
MRVFLAAVMVAVMAGPAFAQQQPNVKYGVPEPDKTQAQKEADQQTERAYRRSLGSIPDKGSSDPWGIVRNDGSPPKNTSTGAPKAAAKIAPKPAKTSGAPN